MQEWRKWENPDSMLKDTIKTELNKALKEGDEIKCSTLRMLLAAIVNKEKEKKYKEKLGGEAVLTGQELIDVIASEAKKRKEAILEFEKGGRQDLVDKEKAELEVLQKYLPEQLSEQEIRSLAHTIIKKLGVENIKDMGKIMAEIMPQIKGRSDGSQVSQIVKEELSSKQTS